MLPPGSLPHYYPLSVDNSPVSTPFSVYLTEVYRGDCTIKLSGSFPFFSCQKPLGFRCDPAHYV